jgi:hypothetical protein
LCGVARHATMRAMPFSRALLAVLAALLVLPAGASAANTWQAGPGFGEDGTGSPALAVFGAGDGSTSAAWIKLEKQPDGSMVNVVVAQRVGGDGTRGPVLRLGTTKASPVGEIKEDPGSAHISVVQTPTGVAVLWLDTKSPDPKATVAALKLARLGPAGVISTTTVDAAADLSPTSSLAPELVGNAGGDLLLSWWSADGRPLVEKVTAGGVASEAVVLPKAAVIGSSLRIALLDDGTGRVAYEAEHPQVHDDPGNNDGGLRVARLTAAGALEYKPDPDPSDNVPPEPNTEVITSGNRQLLSYASLATNGKQAFVTWAEDDPRSGQVYRPGTFLTAPMPAKGPLAGDTVSLGRDEVVGDMDGMAGALATGLSADGTLTTLRQSQPSPGVTTVVLGRLRPGAPPSSVTLAGGTDDPYKFNILPSLAVAPDGNAVVAWTGLKSIGNGQQEPPLPFAVVVAPDGTQGTRYTSSSAGLASAFVTPSGPRIAIWDGQDAPGQILTRAWLPAPPVVQPSAPGPAPAPAPAPVPASTPTPAPLLTGVKLSKTSFAAGTRVQFSLRSSAAGTARIVITRATKGRRVGKACKPLTKKNRKAKTCTYDKVLRTLTAKVAAGRSTIAFDGKAAGRALAAGTYKARITITGASGLVSKPAVVTFKVTKKKTKRK